LDIVPQVSSSQDPPLLEVAIRRIVIAVGLTPMGGQRSQEEAETLAAQALKEAQGGADFGALIAKYSDSRSSREATAPGLIVILNHGVQGETFQSFLLSLNERAARREEELGGLVRSGRLSPEQAEVEMNNFLDQCQDEAESAALPHPRSTLPRGLGDLAFSLEKGCIGILPWSTEISPEGWQVVLREK
tara:strand:- start:1917 stop:2483 length:567 start_codon:yes stop_codon:yes gene_type:complete